LCPFDAAGALISLHRKSKKSIHIPIETMAVESGYSGTGAARITHIGDPRFEIPEFWDLKNQHAHLCLNHSAASRTYPGNWA
jgi:hypothetical protein